MKWKMNENSLFAILLRSSWWISFAIAGAVTAVAIALLPEAYRIFGAVTGLPFMVIGCIAAWRQFRRRRRPASTTRSPPCARCRGSNSPAPSRRPIGGRDTTSAPSAATAANFEITKEGRIALVSCKRWKVAHTGVEPLQELHAMKEARNAQECIYVAAGEFTDNARAFAAKHAIRLVGGAELARLLPGTGRGRKIW